MTPEEYREAIRPYVIGRHLAEGRVIVYWTAQPGIDARTLVVRVIDVVTGRVLLDYTGTAEGSAEAFDAAGAGDWLTTDQLEADLDQWVAEHFEEA